MILVLGATVDVVYRLRFHKAYAFFSMPLDITIFITTILSFVIAAWARNWTIQTARFRIRQEKLKEQQELLLAYWRDTGMLPHARDEAKATHLHREAVAEMERANAVIAEPKPFSGPEPRRSRFWLWFWWWFGWRAA